jgi:hypothetical protein
VEHNHSLFAHVVNHVVKVSMMVVDDHPSQTPARHAVNLGDRAAANDRHGGSEATE